MKKPLILFFLLPLISLFMLHCASNWPKNFGSYTQDEEIKTMFEAHEYVTEYNYFSELYTKKRLIILGGS